jgi:hypothetical protein
MGDDHSRLESGKLGCEGRKALVFAIRGAKFDDNVPPFHITELPETESETVDGRVETRVDRSRAEKSNEGD